MSNDVAYDTRSERPGNSTMTPAAPATGAHTRPAPTRQPRDYRLLRDAALAATAACGLALAYWATLDVPAVATGAVSTVATATAMHSRLAMGRWPAIVQIAAGAALLTWLGAPPRVLGTALACGVIGSEIVARCTNRAMALQAGAWTGLAAAIVYLSGVTSMVSLSESATAREAFAAFGGGLLGAALMFMLGPVAEWLFGHTTRLTLSEWLSYDHPLLRDLAQLAPGTFQHSVNVGVLASAAANAIRADALLVRLGGLYHDVGKMQAPEYFVENQHETNPHDALEPEGSARILRAHVLDGEKLVVEHRMGSRIADFVREHHGTGTMRYFKNKAASAGADVDAIAEAFRYPGPRPRSRESGLLMIADQVEATARASPPADEQACEDVVAETIRRIVEEEELRDSGLSARHLRLAHAAFTRALIAMYHRRVKYEPPSAASPQRKLAIVPKLLGRRQAG